MRDKMEVNCDLKENRGKDICMARIRADVREIRKPYIMVNPRLKMLTVIYKKRVENYVLKSVETKKEIDENNGLEGYDYQDIYGPGWNKSHEYRVLKDSGFHQIGLKDEEDE